MSTNVPSWASFFSPEAYGSFVDEVEAEMVRRDLDFEVTDGVIAVKLPGGNTTQFGLLNLAQLCNQVEPEQWTDTIQNHFDNMLLARASSAELDEYDFEQVRELLRVRIYPADYGDGLDVSLVCRTIGPGMIAVLVYDLPTSIATVNPSHVDRWGRPLDELFELGIANVKRYEEVDVDLLELDGGAQVHTVLGDSFFAASYAIFLDRLVDVGDFGLLVSVPNRHLTLFHRIDDMSVVAAINAMIFIGYRRYEEGPGSITPDLYWYQIGASGPEWTLLPTAVDQNGLTFSPPREFVERVLEPLTG